MKFDDLKKGAKSFAGGVFGRFNKKQEKNENGKNEEIKIEVEKPSDQENNNVSNEEPQYGILDKYIKFIVKMKKPLLWIIAIFFWIWGCLLIREQTIPSILAIIIGLFACPETIGYFKRNKLFSENTSLIVILTTIVWFALASNSGNQVSNNVINHNNIVEEKIEVTNKTKDKDDVVSNIVEEPTKIVKEEKVVVDTTNKIKLSEIPEYKDMPYVEINNNVPFFDDSELTEEAFEKYSDLDSLGRAGIAVACIEKGMDDKPRGNINTVNPTGWTSVKYDGIDGGNLYNRCHIIANQLTGEDDNEKNLMTGTRYFNTQGMERFENQVAEYINNTKNHVLYRVTPMFDGNDLIAKGALIEAKSVEDKGKGVQFNVFCYNVQPGIEIDYKTGDSKKIETEVKEVKNEVSSAATTAALVAGSVVNEEKTEKSTNTNSSNNKNTNPSASTSTSTSTSKPIEDDSTQATYILNTNSKRFHHPWCSSVNQMKEKNKQEYTGTRESLISRGYVPCGRCNP